MSPPMRHGKIPARSSGVASGAMPSERLDAWLRSPAVRTIHTRSAASSPEALWEHAKDVRLSDTRSLGRLVRWRIPGLAPDTTYHDLFRGYPFTVLEEDERLLVSGLCGKIWTLARDYPRLGGAEDFRDWDRGGTVRGAFGDWGGTGRVAFGNGVREAGGGRSELVSEARVEPCDRAAALRLRPLWAVIGRFERLVGAEPLELAARRAERG